MRKAVLALLVPLSLLAAGCIGSAQATAMDARSPADEAARLWSADARLAQVLGVEGTGDLARRGAQWLTGALEPEADGEDARVGDGRAEAWVFRYLSAERGRAFVVVVDEEGAVRRSYEEDKRAKDEPLVGWSVDSDDALRVAKEANLGIGEGVKAEKYGTLAFLVMEDGAPVWHVVGGGRSDEAGGLGYAKVSASDGAVLATWGGFGAR